MCKNLRVVLLYDSVSGHVYLHHIKIRNAPKTEFKIRQTSLGAFFAIRECELASLSSHNGGYIRAQLSIKKDNKANKIASPFNNPDEYRE